MRRLIRKGLFAGCTAIFAALCAPASAQEQIDLTFDQARFLGRQAASQGNVPLALDFANSLLQANPQDFDAWIIRAAAALQGGDAVEGLSAAVAAYRFAPNGIGKYEAARLAALAAANQDRLTLAQWWLRLALVHAPNDAEERQTLTDAAGISRRNPWQTSVRLSFAPSDNVNGGAPGDVLIIDGIDRLLYSPTVSRDAQPLSGWTGALSFSTRYTLREEQDYRLTAGFAAGWNGAWLSDEARAELIADNRYFGNDAFSSRRWETSLDYEGSLDHGSWGISGALGVRQAYDEDELQIDRFFRLNLDGTYVINESNLLFGSAFADREWAVDAGRADSLTTGLSTTYVRALADQTVLSASLGYSRTQSDSANERVRSWTVSAGVQPAQQIGPFDLSGQVSYQFSDFSEYQVLLMVPGGRQDHRFSAGLDLAMPDYSVAGFEPVVTIDASRTTSNVSRFEYDTFGIGLSFQSSF